MTTRPYFAVFASETNLVSGARTPPPQYTYVDTNLPFKIPRKPVPGVPNAPVLPSCQPHLKKSRNRAVINLCHGTALFWRQWKWEAIACFLVLATPMIIVATIFPHAGQPLPQWPFHITINALLSVYSLVFKTCLGFVLASCIGQLQWTWLSTDRPLRDAVRYAEAITGPWGSTKLLWSQHIQQPLTAFGALIFVTTIAIDPFVQQLITPSDCNIAVELQNATLPRTSVLNGDTWSRSLTLGFPLLDAVIQFPSSTINGECLTGNCTFPEYTTIGYCSTCKDRSADVLIDVACVADSHTPKIVNSSCGVDGTSTIPIINSSLMVDVLDDRAFSWLNISFDPVGVDSSISSKPWDVLSTAGLNYQSDMNVSTDKWTLTEIAILVGKTSPRDTDLNISSGLPLQGCNTTATADFWQCQGYGAAICTIQPCVRTFAATIDSGILTETEISRSGSTSWSTVNASLDFATLKPFGMIDVSCLSEGQRAQLEQQGHSLTSRWLPYNISFPNGPLVSDIPSDPDLGFLQSKCLYILDESVAGTLGLTFMGNDFLDRPVSCDSMTYNNTEGAEPTYACHDLTGPSTALALYNNGHIEFQDVEAFFVNVSDALTAWVRNNGDANYSDPAIGTVWRSTTCVGVQWEWLSLLAIVASSTILLFVFVVLTTTKQHLPLWKQSPLAWILRGPGGTPSLRDSGGGRLAAMEEKSEHMVVTLVKGSEPRIQLVRVTSKKEGAPRNLKMRKWLRWRARKQARDTASDCLEREDP